MGSTPFNASRLNAEVVVPLKYSSNTGCHKKKIPLFAVHYHVEKFVLKFICSFKKHLRYILNTRYIINKYIYKTFFKRLIIFPTNINVIEQRQTIFVSLFEVVLQTN